MEYFNIKDIVVKLVKLHETNDPFRLCKYLNIRINYDDLGKLNGLLYQNSRGAVIVLNNNLSDDKLHFACAHELGHYCLEHHTNRFFLNFHTLNRPYRLENEADTFAVELLIPDEDWEEHLLSGCSDDHIAYSAGVPVDMVKLKSS